MADFRNGARLNMQLVQEVVLESLDEMIEHMDGRITKDDFLVVFNGSLCALGENMARFDKECWRECFRLTSPPFDASAANVVMGIGVSNIVKPFRVLDGVIYSSSKYIRLKNKQHRQMENAKLVDWCSPGNNEQQRTSRFYLESQQLLKGRWLRF